MGKERNYDNDGLDPSEEYFRNKEKGYDEDLDKEVSQHYILLMLLLLSSSLPFSFFLKYSSDGSNPSLS